MVGLVVRLAVAVTLLGGAGVATTATDLAAGAVGAPSALQSGTGAPVPMEPMRFDLHVSTAVAQQLNYALTHWHDYNLAGYGDFNPWGGDCQNFVSQTLVARGWVPNDEWFNNAQEEWAPAFVHVPSFDEYLRAHPELGAVAVPIDERERIKLGDLVVYDWDRDGSLDHIEVVARIEYDDAGRIAIATLGHSDVDSWYLDLDRAITVQHPGASAYFWSIP